MILLRPELVAAVEQVDLGREAGQVGRLLERGVAAADDRDLLVPEEEPVARGAGADTPRPRSRVSLSRPSHSADAPVATITASAAVLGAARPDAERPRREVDPVDVDVDDLACRSARPARGTAAISSGPWMPSGKPG